MGKYGVEIWRQKLVPDSVGLSGGSESGWKQRESTHVPRRCEGENVCYATFGEIVEVYDNALCHCNSLWCVEGKEEGCDGI